MIAHSPKKRYELNDNRIRALYGHSMEKKIRKIPSEPPEMLYHGTSRKAATVILEKGLLPMGRQYVHLSRDLKTARLVGRRKDEKPVILKVLAGKAHRHGITFYIGYEEVWLADYVPETFITHESEG
jgi:putative RNA 2'-phosphotransferase